MFCSDYVPSPNSKKLTSEDKLKPRHWQELSHLHDHLETFYEATLMVEGNQTTLADHFQTLDWLLLELEKSKLKFLELEADKPRSPQAKNFQYLAGCAEEAWQKAEKYYKLADQTAAYYAAIVLDPTLKMQWFKLAWGPHEVKKEWISTVEEAVRELWSEYKGKGRRQSSSAVPSFPQPAPPKQKEKTYTSARDHKRLKITHETDVDIADKPQELDAFDDFIKTNPLKLKPNEQFSCIEYWYNRLETQPDLAQFALDILAVPPISDDCERLFSSAKILLEDRRSCLNMDIIEANECLRHSYGPPVKGTFDSEDVGAVEGEPQPPYVSPAEASRRRVAAYEAATGAGQQAEDEAVEDKVVEDKELEKQYAAIEGGDGDDIEAGGEEGEDDEDDQ